MISAYVDLTKSRRDDSLLSQNYISLPVCRLPYAWGFVCGRLVRKWDRVGVVMNIVLLWKFRKWYNACVEQTRSQDCPWRYCCRCDVYLRHTHLITRTTHVRSHRYVISPDRKSRNNPYPRNHRRRVLWSIVSKAAIKSSSTMTTHRDCQCIQRRRRVSHEGGFRTVVRTLINAINAVLLHKV